MLSTEQFEVWCLQHHLSEQARALVERIRSSPPSRLVRGAAGNVSGRYPSQKMGCTIQFESHRGELAFIYHLEHDPAVFEFFDQDINFIADFHGFDVFKFVGGDDALAFVADVHEDFFGTDFDDSAFDDIASRKGQGARLLHGLFHGEHK